MDSLTFTINLKDLNDSDNPEESINDLKLIIKFLQNANPNYYLIGNLLDEQLKAQLEKKEDPAIEMKKKFCEIFDATNIGKGMFSAWDVDEHHGDEPVPGYWDAWDNFMNQIGEAMGPICYAGYKLKMKFIEAGYYADWVDECIDYYEKNWQF